MTSEAQWILWALAAFELLVALYILAKYKRTASIYALVGSLLGFTLMAIFVGLQLGTNDDAVRTMFGRLAFYGGCVTFTSGFALSLAYPILSNIQPQRRALLIGLPLAFFLPYILFVPSFLTTVTLDGMSLTIVPGSAFWLFTLFAAGYWVATAVILLRKLPKISGTLKKQATLFTVVYIISAAIGLIVAFIFPLFNVPINAVIGGLIPGVSVLFIAGIVLRR